MKGSSTKSSLPYVIFELANTHGGDVENINELISAFGKIAYSRKAIKFQVFHPEKISLPDFPWFSVYEELWIDELSWIETIKLAKSHGDVWIDVFDVYSVEIIKSCKHLITGVKFQASVLDNYEVAEHLKGLDLSETFILLNVSGFSIKEISRVVQKFEKLSQNLILQVGFQDYPTNIKDTGLSKIPLLQEAFPAYPISIADHAAAEDDFAKVVPAFASLMGCEFLEKHFCIDRVAAKYDGYSSLEPLEMAKTLKYLEDLKLAKNGPFISKSEKQYLAKSIQSPISKSSHNAGVRLDSSDVIFRRTAQNGLNLEQILHLQQNGYRLAKTHSVAKTFLKTDFQRAQVGAVVAVRMKSTRLKQKAIKPINGIASIDRCLGQCLAIPGVNKVVLATSNLPDDLALRTHNFEGRVQFFAGNPHDVISRYIGACENFDIDVVIRVTGDCPFLSTEIAEFLLKKHFESGADFTEANKFAVGTACEIIEVSALKEIVKLFGEAEYSEYMSWYFTNNPGYFKINTVDLPKNFVRKYRLTLDYQEDLDMFEELYKRLDSQGQPTELAEVFRALDTDPSISQKNEHIGLKYKTDEQLISLLNKYTKINK